jgi:hypothetical protein
MKTTTMRTNMPTTAPTQISIIKETEPFPLPPNSCTNGALAGDMTDLRELKLEVKVQEDKRKIR